VSYAIIRESCVKNSNNGKLTSIKSSISVPDSASTATTSNSNVTKNKHVNCETSVSSSTSSTNFVWEKKKSSRKVDEVTSVLKKSARAFSPDITYEIKRLPHFKTQNNSKNNSISSNTTTISVLNVNGSVDVDVSRTGQINGQKVSSNKKVEVNCVQHETISKEINVQFTKEQLQKQQEEVEEQINKHEGPVNGIIKPELLEKPKKKKRAKRRRLVVRKSKGGKKKKATVKAKTIPSSEDSSTVTNEIDATDSIVFVPTIECLGDKNHQEAQSCSKTKAITSNISQAKEELKVLNGKFNSSLLSIKDESSGSNVSSLSSTEDLLNNTKNETQAAKKNPVNQNDSLVIKDENIECTTSSMFFFPYYYS